MSKIKVFFSHKHDLKEATKRLQWYLGRLAPERFDFFASSSDIEEGADWRDRVKHELTKADWLIAVTTQCGVKSKDWIIHEISSFCEINRAILDDSSGKPQEKRCIIIHDEGDRLEVFSNLLQFSATKDGCRDFLRRLLSTGRGCDGFNPYIGDETSELKKEAERLWEILAASPPPYLLLPKGKFRLTPASERKLDEDVIDDAMLVTLDRMAASMHNITLPEGHDQWEGTFEELRDSMSDNQKPWIPLMAFLLRKILRERRFQQAYVLYPDCDDEEFFNPVVSQLFEYPSGDKFIELLYFPVETGFKTRGLTDRDHLYQLLILCVHTQWRLVDRYSEEVENLAAKERSELVDLTDEDMQGRIDLSKRILIDLMKVHSESAARGIVNPDRILNLFPESERQSVEDDFKTWIEVFTEIQNNQTDIEATKLEESLRKAEGIITRGIKRYSAILASPDVW